MSQPSVTFSEVMPARWIRCTHPCIRTIGLSLRSQKAPSSTAEMQVAPTPIGQSTSGSAAPAEDEEEEEKRAPVLLERGPLSRAERWASRAAHGLISGDVRRRANMLVLVGYTSRRTREGGSQ